MSNIKKQFTVKDILDALPDFRHWIEETKLFNVIVEQTNPNRRLFNSTFGSAEPYIVSEEISMHLKLGVPIITAYDLPIELIQNFYANSPYFNLAKDGVDEIYFPYQNLLE